MSDPHDPRTGAHRVVIVGAGMAGARLAEELAGTDELTSADARLHVTLLGAEADQPYNRIRLSHRAAATDGADPARSTRLRPEGWWARRGIDLRTGVQVTGIDREARLVGVAARRAEAPGVEQGGGPSGALHASDTRSIAYDTLVLATGADAALPPIDGAHGPDGALAGGVHTLRSAADCRALTAHLTGSPDAPIALVGGGFIGLEVACALAAQGRDVTVIHPRKRPMDGVLDDGAGAAVVRALRDLGVRAELGARATRWDGRTVHLDDGRTVAAGTVLLSAGTRPRTELARDAGLEVGRGIVVDDRLATSDPAILAVGDCAEHHSVVTGLVAPAWDQVAVVVDRLTGQDQDARYRPRSRVTRLKAPGLDVVGLGTLAPAAAGGGIGGSGTAEVESTVVSEAARGRYARADVRAGTLVGAVLVGRPEPAGLLTQIHEGALPVPEDALGLLLGRTGAPAAVDSPEKMPSAAVVCRCNGVSKADVVTAYRSGATSPESVAGATRATTGCGGCASAVEGLCEWLHRTRSGGAQADPRPCQDAVTTG